jgi:hypothetical protein
MISEPTTLLMRGGTRMFAFTLPKAAAPLRSRLIEIAQAPVRQDSRIEDAQEIEQVI